jgi:hypothetical protein
VDSCTRMQRTKPLLGFLLFLLTSFAGLAGCRNSGFPDHAAAQTQPSQPGVLNLGRIWRVEEGYYDEPHWVGIWTRRGQTNIFDATWKHAWMNETTQDVVEVQLAKDGQVVVFRRNVKQYYRGTYSAQHPNKLRGRADWFGPDLIWTADIEY